MSLAMGHSIETHCREYPWVTKSATINAFEIALAAWVIHFLQTIQFFSLVAASNIDTLKSDDLDEESDVDGDGK